MNHAIRHIIVFAGLLGLLIFSGACSPQKRLNRLLDHHPELKSDTTITLHDTVIRPAIFFDTAYSYINVHDTVTLEHQNIQVKVYHHHDTVYVSARAKADTVIREIKVPVNRVVYTKGETHNWKWFWIGIASVLFILAVILIVVKFFK